MQEFGANIVTIPTHLDICGTQAKRIAQIEQELKDYSSYAVLHVCTKLMLLLTSDKANSPEVQGSLAAELLDSDSIERLRAFLKANSDSRQQFFHHKSVLMLLKLNLEKNDPEGKNIETPEDKAKIGSWLLSFTGMWIPNERIANRGRKYFYENLRINMSQQYLQESNEKIINLLARGDYLIEKVQAVKSLEFGKLFKEATGITVELYVEILFMVMTQWTIDTGNQNLDDIAIRNVDQFFQNTKLKREDIDAFMKIIGFRIEEFDDLKKTALQKVRLNDGPDNFIAFIEKPILLYESNFICISPTFLALKLTEGPYRVVEEALKDKKNKNQLADEWSLAYEAYVNERLAKTFKNCNPNIKEANSESDNLISTKKCGLLVETKYTHWTFTARVTGAKADMKGYLGRIARYKKWKPKPGQPWSFKKLGLGQIKQFYEDIQGKLSDYDLVDKPIIPLLVLGEGFPFDPGNRQFLEDFAIRENCIIKEKHVLPFITVDSSELELMESFSQKFGEDYVVELLAQYATSLDMKKARQTPVHQRSTSLHNFFYATGETTKNNDFLRSKLDKLSERVLKHMMKPDPSSKS